MTDRETIDDGKGSSAVSSGRECDRLTYGLLLCALMTLMALLSAPEALAGAAARENARPLDQKELRQLFPGRFVAFVRGYRVRFVARGNGRLEGYYGALKDHGRWSLRGGRLCITLQDWLDGRTTCSRVRRRDGRWLHARGIRFRRL